MPIYEFQCRDCGESFERLAPTMAARNDAVECPKCHSRKAIRKLSAFAVAAAQSPSAGDADPGVCPCGKMNGSCGGGN